MVRRDCGVTIVISPPRTARFIGAAISHRLGPVVSYAHAKAPGTRLNWPSANRPAMFARQSSLRESLDDSGPN